MSLICATFVLILCRLVTVDGGTRAVIFDKIFGISDKVVGEGSHIRIPFLQEPVIMDIRSRPRLFVVS